jgi:DNA-binding CsgD family transcriptional regulator
MSPGALNGVIFQDQSLSGMIGLIRRCGAPRFGRAEVRLLQTLMPHLQRAVQLHQRIITLESEKNVASDALNLWSLGVILLDNQGKPFLTNRSADTILKQHDGLTLNRAGLSAATSADTRTMHAAIHGAIHTTSFQASPSTLTKTVETSTDGLTPGDALLISRPSGKQPLQVLVAPACANPILFPIHGAAAIVFISDPEATERPQAELFQHFYGLTTAETQTQIAALLLEGKSVPLIAGELGVSLNTAKTHAKRIYDKTRSKGQADLIRLILRSPAQTR